MDIQQLQQFLAIVDHGTVGKAARHLRVSQPALSQTVARLEARLAVKLFNRTSQGMIPTPFGATLAARARNISEEARRAVEDLDALKDIGRTRISVGTGPSHANTIVPEATRRVLASRPGITVAIVEGTLAGLMPGLERGDVDLAVVTASNTPWERELAAEPLYSDRVVIAARRNHPLDRSAIVTLADCARFPWVLPPHADVLRQRIETLFQQADLPPPKVDVETGSATAIKALVANSDFLAWVPQGLIRMEEATDVLLALPVAGCDWRRDVKIVYRQSRSLPPAARTMIRQLKLVAREYGPRSVNSP